jgi:hypothetical protein
MHVALNNLPPYQLSLGLLAVTTQIAATFQVTQVVYLNFCALL